jgi:hypothetical protein
MDEEEITRSLTKLDQFMNKLIFAFMQKGISYRQAEEELFRRLKRKRYPRETEDVHRNDTKLSHQPPNSCLKVSR